MEAMNADSLFNLLFGGLALLVVMWAVSLMVSKTEIVFKWLGGVVLLSVVGVVLYGRNL